MMKSRVRLERIEPCNEEPMEVAVLFRNLFPPDWSLKSGPASLHEYDDDFERLGIRRLDDAVAAVREHWDGPIMVVLFDPVFPRYFLVKERAAPGEGDQP